MKITITPEEGETMKEIVYENVTEFTIGGLCLENKIIPKIFRSSVIRDKATLIGITKMLEEDIRNHVDNANNTN